MVPLELRERYLERCNLRPNVKSRWLQENPLQKILECQKIKGEDNPADGLTKHVRQELAQRYSQATHVRIRDGRAKSSLKLAT